MGKVLYEIPTGYENIIAALIIPFVMLLFIIILAQRPPRIDEYYSTKSSAAKRRPRIGFLLLEGIFVFVCGYVIFKGQLAMYRGTVIPYLNGDYEIVEGYVEDFVPMPREGHAMEKFNIKGVHFEYSDYNMITGYNKARVNGGVIRRNGQYLRIGYVYYNNSYGNIIVYIEELTPP